MIIIAHNEGVMLPHPRVLEPIEYPCPPVLKSVIHLKLCSVDFTGKSKG